MVRLQNKPYNRLYLIQLIYYSLTAMGKQIHNRRSLEKLGYFRLWNSSWKNEFQAPVIKWFESFLWSKKFWVCIEKFLGGSGTFKLQCTLRLYSWTAPFSLTCERSLSIIMVHGWPRVWQIHILFYPFQVLYYTHYQGTALQSKSNFYFYFKKCCNLHEYNRNQHIK